MPYITAEDRKEIHEDVGEELASIGSVIDHSQDLGQVIFHLAWMYLNRLTQEQPVSYPVLVDHVRQIQNEMRRRVRVTDLVEWCNDIGMAIKVHPGHYNYVISYIIHQWLIRYSVSYTRINRVIGVIDRIKSQFQDKLDCLLGHCDEMEVLDDVEGVLTCIQFELYRVLAAPYEDDKADENGPVSVLDEPFFQLRKQIRALANGG